MRSPLSSDLNGGRSREYARIQAAPGGARAGFAARSPSLARARGRARIIRKSSKARAAFTTGFAGGADVASCIRGSHLPVTTLGATVFT
jgi:hypothetical protein